VRGDDSYSYRAQAGGGTGRLVCRPGRLKSFCSAGVIDTPQTALLPNSEGRDTPRSKFTFSEERLDLPPRQRPRTETLITFCQRLVPYNPLILHCSFIRLLSLFGQMCHRIVERFNIAFPRNSLRNWLFNRSQTVRGPNASYRLKPEKQVPHQSRVPPLQSTNQHFNQREIHMLCYRLPNSATRTRSLTLSPLTIVEAFFKISLPFFL